MPARLGPADLPIAYSPDDEPDDAGHGLGPGRTATRAAPRTASAFEIEVHLTQPDAGSVSDGGSSAGGAAQARADTGGLGLDDAGFFVPEPRRADAEPASGSPARGSGSWEHELDKDFEQHRMRMERGGRQDSVAASSSGSGGAAERAVLAAPPEAARVLRRAGMAMIRDAAALAFPPRAGSDAAHGPAARAAAPTSPVRTYRRSDRQTAAGAVAAYRRRQAEDRLPPAATTGSRGEEPGWGGDAAAADDASDQGAPQAGRDGSVARGRPAAPARSGRVAMAAASSAIRATARRKRDREEADPVAEHMEKWETPAPRGRAGVWDGTPSFGHPTSASRRSGAAAPSDDQGWGGGGGRAGRGSGSATRPVHEDGEPARRRARRRDAMSEAETPTAEAGARGPAAARRRSGSVGRSPGPSEGSGPAATSPAAPAGLPRRARRKPADILGPEVPLAWEESSPSSRARSASRRPVPVPPVFRDDSSSPSVSDDDDDAGLDTTWEASKPARQPQRSVSAEEDGRAHPEAAALLSELGELQQLMEASRPQEPARAGRGRTAGRRRGSGGTAGGAGGRRAEPRGGGHIRVVRGVPGQGMRSLDDFMAEKGARAGMPRALGAAWDALDGGRRRPERQTKPAIGAGAGGLAAALAGARAGPGWLVSAGIGRRAVIGAGSGSAPALPKAAGRVHRADTTGEGAAKTPAGLAAALAVLDTEPEAEDGTSFTAGLFGASPSGPLREAARSDIRAGGFGVPAASLASHPRCLAAAPPPPSPPRRPERAQGRRGRRRSCPPRLHPGDGAVRRRRRGPPPPRAAAPGGAPRHAPAAGRARSGRGSVSR